MKKFLSIFAVSLLLVSCGESSEKSSENEVKEYKISPETTSVKGSLKDYYEVVDREYKLTKDYNATEVNIELKRNETPFTFDVNDVTDMYDSDETTQSQVFGIGIEFIDADGEIIATCEPKSYDDDILLLNLNSGETGSIKMSTYEDGVYNNAVKFRVTSIIKENERKKDLMDKIIDSELGDKSVEDIDMEDVEKAAKTAKTAVEAAGALFELAGSLSE